MVRPELICLPSATFIYSFKKTERKGKISTAPSKAFFSQKCSSNEQFHLTFFKPSSRRCRGLFPDALC